MARYFYSDSVADFLAKTPEEIFGAINAVALAAEAPQELAWLSQISILQSELASFSERGSIYFEFAVPRIGKRIDVVLLLDAVVFVVEFKVGEELFRRAAVEQAWDYALDLKNFHDASHSARIAPIVVATAAISRQVHPQFSSRDDDVLVPLLVAPAQLGYALSKVLEIPSRRAANPTRWHEGRYHPTHDALSECLRGALGF